MMDEDVIRQAGVDLKSARKVIEFYGDKELSARLMLAEEGGKRAREWLTEHSDE